MVDRVVQGAHQAVDRLAERATPAVERLAERASPTVDRLRQRVDGATGSMHAQADRMMAMEQEWVTVARSFVREHPLTSVAVAVLAGMAIGRMR